MRPLALVRPPSDSYARCLREDASAAPDPTRARLQHQAYRGALGGLAQVIQLPSEPELPDACFVEDAAVARGRVAVVTRPGAPSRRPEVESIARALEPLADCRRMTRGSLDGGDVMVLGGAVYVGLSARTDREGAEELAKLLELELRPVSLGRWLHLKTAVTPIGDAAAVQLRGAYPPGTFPGVELVEVDEPYGGNVLRVGGGVLVSAAAPRTAETLAARGLSVRVIDVGEFHKGDGALTCLSLVLG